MRFFVQNGALRVCCSAFVFLVVGCTNNPDDKARTLTTPKTDKDQIRECLDSLMREQEAGRAGEFYWDDFVRTSIDDPNLLEYGKKRVKLIRASQALEAHLKGPSKRPTDQRTTISQIVRLNAVRSWRVLDATDVTLWNADESRKNGREGFAKAVIRIDSSGAGGVQIKSDWNAFMLKHNGHWKVDRLSPPPTPGP